MAVGEQITALIGGGPVEQAVLTDAASRASLIVGVDGGARHLHAAGITPDAVIGDMDSAPSDLDWPDEEPEEIHVTDQETTDFEKALTHFGAGLFLAIGFTGGRSDHYLAVLDTTLRYPDHQVVLMDEFTTSVLAPIGDVHLKLPIGTRLSLMPLAPTECHACTGLEWSIAGWSMALGEGISISNKVAETPVILNFSNRAVLLQAPADIGPSWALALAGQA